MSIYNPEPLRCSWCDESFHRRSDLSSHESLHRWAESADPKVITSHVYPPIPDRSNDWCAYRDGREEDGPYGWGATETAALADLKEQEDADKDLGPCA